MLFTRGLAKRLAPGQSAYSLHPGVIGTNLARSLGVVGKVFVFFLKLFSKNPLLWCGGVMMMVLWWWPVAVAGFLFFFMSCTSTFSSFVLLGCAAAAEFEPEPTERKVSSLSSPVTCGPLRI